MSKKENKSIYKSAKEKTCDSNGLLCNSLSVAWSCPGIISCDAESAEQPHLCMNSLIRAKYTQESTNLHHVQIFLSFC